MEINSVLIAIAQVNPKNSFNRLILFVYKYITKNVVRLYYDISHC